MKNAFSVFFAIFSRKMTLKKCFAHAKKGRIKFTTFFFLDAAKKTQEKEEKKFDISMQSFKKSAIFFFAGDGKTFQREPKKKPLT